MPGKKSINKGKWGELEVVHLMRDLFGLEAKRLGHAQSSPAAGLPDVQAGELRIEVKRRKKLPAYLKPSQSVDMVLTREDYGEWLVVVPLTKLMEVCAKLKGEVEV